MQQSIGILYVIYVLDRDLSFSSNYLLISNCSEWLLKVGWPILMILANSLSSFKTLIFSNFF